MNVVVDAPHLAPNRTPECVGVRQLTVAWGGDLSAGQTIELQ